MACNIAPVADLTNATLLVAAPVMQCAERLVFLRTCEQEGIGPGQLTPADWPAVINEAAIVFDSWQTLPDR